MPASSLLSAASRMVFKPAAELLSTPIGKKSTANTNQITASSSSRFSVTPVSEYPGTQSPSASSSSRFWPLTPSQQHQFIDSQSADTTGTTTRVDKDLLSPTIATTAADDAPQQLTIAQQTIGIHRFCKPFRNRFVIHELLGEGGFGFVVSAFDSDQQNEEVAVKFILKDKVPISSYIKDPESGSSIPLEIYILKKARHPNIVRFIAWYEDPKFFYLVTELHGSEWIPTNRTLKKADGDFIRQRPSLDLFECIDAHERFPEKTAKIVFRQIVSAVHYLHTELNVCHRDLKDENVVVDKNFIVKLIDFGAAAFIPSENKRLFTTFHGTLQYCPPEIIRGEKYRGPEAEVWGLGVLLYTMLFGENPFNDPKNVVSEDISIIDLAAGCGCTVYIGGKLLTRPALQQQSQSADIDSLVDETHRLKLTNSNNIEFTNSILPIATPAAKQSQSHTSVIRLSIAAMDLMSRMLIRDPEKRATMRQVVRDLWLI